MSELPDKPQMAKPKRRWFRFSVRALLLLTGLIACWLAIHANRAREQQAAVAAIEDAGGEVIYDWALTAPAPGNGPPNPLWMRFIFGDDYFQNVAVVQIEYEDLSPGLYETLQQLDTLKVVLVDGRGDLQPVQDALPGVPVVHHNSVSIVLPSATQN